ncbi:hypothetical protein IWQ62_005396 [Dispira parvispora]|uniref:Uncharacterized protein n=1 Tax=Dispira parvispora TaxID=1520584 RepID=A0A9W8DZP8_9FUNG|nr:hypothetical protein IWQ62_005396 [Dispira parvispora]
MRTRSGLDTRHPNPSTESRPHSRHRRESQKVKQPISDPSASSQQKTTTAPGRPSQGPTKPYPSKQGDSQSNRTRKPLVPTPPQSPPAGYVEQSNTSDSHQSTPTSDSAPGLKRLFRWHRAESFELQPSPAVYRILQSNRKYEDPKVDESIFYGAL